MLTLKSIERTARALKYIGSQGQEEEFLKFIGPGSQFLRTKFETVGGPGRGAVLGFYICSAKRTWLLKPNDSLVIFDDQNMEVMNDETIKMYFEETE